MSAATPSPMQPRSRDISSVAIPAALIALAAIGWWWSARMAASMSMNMGMDMAAALSLASFLIAWVAMMVAMMFPAVLPVARLYARAAAAGPVAPVPIFLAGYLIVWTVIGLPAFFIWRSLAGPLAMGALWAGRLAGVVLIAAAIYQLTPLKSACLRHCRTPMSFFMRYGNRLDRPLGALQIGVVHGAFCLGCCWALMAVLVAFGTMQLWWMVGLAVLIFVEKNVRWGEQAARVSGAGFALLGVLLLAYPAFISHLV